MILTNRINNQQRIEIGLDVVDGSNSIITHAQNPFRWLQLTLLYFDSVFDLRLKI